MGMITQFCFPDKEKFPKHNLSQKSKKFTFVVTNIEGVKRFGYVRRSLTGQISIANQGKRWPVCHCILSVFPCHSIFDQILEATSRLEAPQVLDLMTQLQNHSLPAPGDAIYATIAVGDSSAPRLEPFRFNRPDQEQSLSGFADFKALLTTIDPFTIVAVLMALLMERRVIFISRKLSTLSSCVQACVALLYPFSWQHVFIPVLPLGMIQFVCAPVPFVVGLLSSHLPDLQAQAELMDEVLLIDVESSSPVPPSTDFKLVPEKYLLPLVATIAKARKVVLDEKKKPKSDKSVGDKLKNFFHSGPSEKNLMTPGARTTVALAEYYRESQPQDNVAKMMENAFISFFAETMGHYTNYLTASSFDKEGFLTFDPTVTAFLRGIAGSQLFEQFIAQRQQSSRIKTKTQTNPLSSRRALTCHADLSTDAKLSEVIIREGYVSKWGKGMKGTAWARFKEGKDHRGIIHEHTVGTFQLRWWKLSYWTLSYHKSEDSKPSGSIQLQDIEAINLAEFRGVKDCIEIVTADRAFQLHTENNADLMWWFELLTWKLASLREYYPKNGTYNPTSPPHMGVNAQASESPRPTLSSNTSAEAKATTSIHPELAPSTMPAPRAKASGSVNYPSASAAGVGGGGSAMASTSNSRTSPGNRPASKTIVSSYVKERLSNERINAASITGSAGEGANGKPPPVAPKPNWAQPLRSSSSNPSLNSPTTTFGGSAFAAQHQQFAPTSSPPVAPPSAPDTASGRGRSAAMRGATDAKSESPVPALPSAKKAGAAKLAASSPNWGPSRSDVAEVRHPAPVPHSASFSAGSSSSSSYQSKTSSGSRAGLPKQGQHFASSRELRKTNSNEDSTNTADILATSNEANSDSSAMRSGLISNLSLSPPKARTLPTAPSPVASEPQNYDYGLSPRKESPRALPQPPALKAPTTASSRSNLTKTVPAPATTTTSAPSAPQAPAAARAKTRPLPKPPSNP
jgi:hypothetical protein